MNHLRSALPPSVGMMTISFLLTEGDELCRCLRFLNRVKDQKHSPAGNEEIVDLTEDVKSNSNWRYVDLILS